MLWPMWVVLIARSTGTALRAVRLPNRYVTPGYPQQIEGLVTYKIDADAKREDIEALVAQSQKRSAVYDIVTNPTNVTVVVE